MDDSDDMRKNRNTGGFIHQACESTFCSGVANSQISIPERAGLVFELMRRLSVSNPALLIDKVCHILTGSVRSPCCGLHEGQCLWINTVSVSSSVNRSLGSLF